ncbi:MAG: 2-amino-4-hydroxy-6-hydroxymethyldihydropteridine diphosphokinase [Thermoguttaceae bacterium]|jgi:2-amino-4-hydroxy-6-hydroxymethyldihydropteridine diphosphokinase|nr:2-amino-4-hydroxy-6-hydroxymethyldihydropteridine diphosphokinase [Thermoguttaceae bacterium]
MAHCLIALGSNLGDRLQTLERAIDDMTAHPAFRVVARSRWHQTRPVGGPVGQGEFLNGALLGETTLSPNALLEWLQDLERRLGRQRTTRWGPRTIDLDLLLYDHWVVDSPSLVLPHPRMAWRRFVLAPAAEVAPGMVHPTTGWTIARLLRHLDTSVPYVAITGPIAAGKSALARLVAAKVSGRVVAETCDPASLAQRDADRSGNAWGVEIEFLKQRARLLAVCSPEWTAPRMVALSDFWFDQSLAFARVWLGSDQFEDFQGHWEVARRSVVQPRLTVFVDGPTHQLLHRIRQRKRPGEDRLTAEILDRLRSSLQTELRRPDRGPVLRLAAGDLAPAAEQLRAAIQSMA